MLEEIAVRSTPWAGYFQDVVSPDDGARAAPGPLEIRGYAFASGERSVSRVDVSLDRGVTWEPAELLDDLGPWAWRHWRIEVDLHQGEHQIIVRAWDTSAATQPEDEAALWNHKWYVDNARPHITVHAVSPDERSIQPDG